MAKRSSRSKKLALKKFRPASRGFLNKKTLIVFVFVLGVAGAWFLSRSFAEGEIADVSKKIFVDYSTAGAYALQNQNGKLTATNQPIQVRIMQDGSIFCNNGTADSLNSAKLNPGDLGRLYQRINELGFKGIDQAIVLPSQTPEKFAVTKAESIMVSKPRGTVEKSVTVPEQSEKPAEFKAVEELLRQECKRANKRVELRTLPKLLERRPQLPRDVREEGEARGGVTVTDVTDLVKDYIFPKAYAYGHYSYQLEAEHAQDGTVNNHRYYDHGFLPLTQISCAKTSSRIWSYHMASNQPGPGGSHIWHSDIAALIGLWCGPGWTHLAENVHWRWESYSGNVLNDPARIRQSAVEAGVAFLNSPPHHDNIHNTSFTKSGYGVVLVNFPGHHFELYVTQHLIAGNTK